MFSRFTSRLAQFQFITALVLLLGSAGAAYADLTSNELKNSETQSPEKKSPEKKSPGNKNERANAHCPAWLQHSVQRLHSTKKVNLCDLLNGKPALIVNTASHCGFTKQFKGLEALHQRYASAGLVVLGVPSNDFNQEAASSEAIAKVCYKNFGVSFTMLAPQHVRGAEAMPLFSYLATQSQAPNLNFNKYLLAPDAKVTHFGSSQAPNSSALTQAIERVLAVR